MAPSQTFEIRSGSISFIPVLLINKLKLRRFIDISPVKPDHIPCNQI